MATCSACGAGLPAEAAFCAACGRPTVGDALISHTRAAVGRDLLVVGAVASFVHVPVVLIGLLYVLLQLELAIPAAISVLTGVLGLTTLSLIGVGFIGWQRLARARLPLVVAVLVLLLALAQPLALLDSETFLLVGPAVGLFTWLLAGLWAIDVRRQLGGGLGVALGILLLAAAAWQLLWLFFFFFSSAGSDSGLLVALIVAFGVVQLAAVTCLGVAFLKLRHARV